MPNLNGFETAALIFEREKLKHIPIIFITAITYGEENIFKGYRTGGVDYIYKPINPELLRAKVAVFIDLYKKNQQLVLQEKKLMAINKTLQNEISERKSSEEQIIELNKELIKNIDGLEKANKELDRFAFMASHDLQEPLRKIRAFSERLAEKNKDRFDEDDTLNLARIQKSASRLQELIKDILSFSKISVEANFFKVTDMGQLLQEVIEELQPIILEKNALVIPAALPALPVNPGLMKTVFLNLINNAVKYAKKEEPPVIEIYCDSYDERKQGGLPGSPLKYCRIYVRDNGIGFDQEYAELIFEMFQRLHSQQAYPGTGIGLALCKRIAEKHNGFISALSREKEGSTFIVSLPYENIPGKKI